MAGIVKFFGVLEITPFWKKQDIHSEFVEIYLILGIFGATIPFWTLLITFGSFFSNKFLISLTGLNSSFLVFFSSLLVNLFASIFIALFSIYIILKNHILFQDLDFQESWNKFSTSTKESLLYRDTMDEEDSDRESYHKEMMTRVLNRFYLIVASVVGSGLLTGVIWSISLFLPWYIIYIVIFFVISSIFEVTSFSFLFAIIVAWILMYRFVVLRKLQLTEKDSEFVQPKEYAVGEREIDIIVANKPPIVCPSCRSFVAASSQECPVCGDPIEIIE